MNDTNFALARHNMVEQQIRTWNMLDQSVLAVLEQFSREKFVPEEYRQMAYMDIAIPLSHDQEMMHPKIEAHLLQALDIRSTDKILEIGTGSGCVTGLLATMGSHVDSVDIFPDFQASAAQKLNAAGISNFTMIEGDGSTGWGEDSQYDVIAITGALPELPEQFKQALTIDGRLFTIVGEGKTMQALSIHRSFGNHWEEKVLFETELPYLVNAEKPQAFIF